MQSTLSRENTRPKSFGSSIRAHAGKSALAAFCALVRTKAIDCAHRAAPPCNRRRRFHVAEPHRCYRPPNAISARRGANRRQRTATATETAIFPAESLMRICGLPSLEVSLPRLHLSRGAIRRRPYRSFFPSSPAPFLFEFTSSLRRQTSRSPSSCARRRCKYRTESSRDMPATQCRKPSRLP